MNLVSVKDKSTLPLLSELLDSFAGCTVYSKLDLKQAFKQIRVHPDDVHKTAFSTPLGHFEWLVMPEGLCNAPCTFQALMQIVLRDRFYNGVVAFEDDILIGSKSLETHAADVEWVLQQLRKHKLYAEMDKSEFCKSEIDFLGHTISASGVSIQKQKVQAILDWPVPTNVKEVRSFLGMAGYHRRFIKGFSQIAAPLTELLKHDRSWKWGSVESDAFKALKDATCTAPVLVIPNLDLPFTISTDASGFAIGAVLSQDHGKGQQPVAFLSHKMNAAERNYPVHEQELLAVVAAMKEWRCYLLGSKHGITVITDHRSLQYINTQPRLSPRQIRWVEYLQQFQPLLELTYRPGRENVIADALSRRPDIEKEVSAERNAQATTGPPAEPRLQLFLAPISTIERSAIMDEVKLAAARDSDYRKMLKHPKDWGYSKVDGVLYTFDNCLIVPNERTLRTRILKEVHDAPTGGHLGIEKTISRLGRVCWWPGQRQEVQEYVKSCVACQANKAINQRPAGLLQPLPIPTKNWEVVSMDFIGPLPVTNRQHDSIMVVVDKLSKMAHFIPTRTTVTAPQAADLYWREVVRYHGIPSAIVSDRDSRFTSNFWQALWKMMGTGLSMSTSYHPQTDGQTERVNRVLEEMLRSYVNDHMTDWDECLVAAEVAVNSSQHSSTGYSPYYLNNGQDIQLPIDKALKLANDAPSNEAAADVIKVLANDLHQARHNLKLAQLHQAKYADQERKEVEYKQGDRVMLSTGDRSPAKLSSRYSGPYTIKRIMSPVNVELDLPKGMKIHPVFHVSKLKPYTDSVVDFPGRQQMDRPAPVIEDNGEAYWNIESILKVRDRVLGGRGRSKKTIKEYLVKWQGYDLSEASWVPRSDMTDDMEEMVQEFHSKLDSNSDSED